MSQDNHKPCNSNARTANDGKPEASAFEWEPDYASDY